MIMPIYSTYFGFNSIRINKYVYSMPKSADLQKVSLN